MTSHLVRYAILGQIELCDGERRLSPGGPQQVKLLAFLLVHANHAVSIDELLGALGGDRMTPADLKRLRVAIARLRKTLGHPDEHPDGALRTVAGGYLLAVSPGELDADAFEAQVTEARAALQREDPGRAAEILRDAERLWRGPALADARYEDWAQPEIRRLEALRLAAIEHRLDADMRLGRHAELTGELEMLIVSHPSRERLAELLMLALYRCGRQGEALDVFARTRTRLMDELGLEPGPTLKMMQAKILEQSASLDAVTARSAEPQQGADARRPLTVLAVRADVDDPEALHSVFERCGPVIERYGGTLARYFGDVLVGLFGCEGSHGDDGLRATRAATELCAASGALRIGIESGEVFLPAGGDLAAGATGAAIATAGTLAQRAAAGEILLGAGVRHAVADAAVDPVTGRLLALQFDRPALLRTQHTPFVGRARELEELQRAFATARGDRICRLVTLVGPAGIGKSRLAGEFLATVGTQATVLAGRCLAYGEGTTYLALADIVRQLGGDAPRERLAELLPGEEQAIHAVLAAIGHSHEPTQPEETAWALRRLLERLARDRPLVVAVEDVHWADEVLLDLIEHVVALSTGEPILILCLTRPELLETRPAWAAPHPARSIVVLDGLPDMDACDLARRLGATQRAAQIARRAEGSPLFVEQLVAAGADTATAELPASVHAVLAARIDGLSVEQRTLLQRAAVEGRTFHAGSVEALLPEHARPGMTVQLVALAHRGLIVADRSGRPGEEAFRFTHALIRDAAYAGLSIFQRAKLHARLARWLEQRPLSAHEIVGYHLEQACLLERSLGHGGARELAVAADGAAHLEAAAAAARARGEASAACALLRRAVRLVEADEVRRVSLLPTLGAALLDAGCLVEAGEVLDEAIDEAPARELEARALVERELVRLRGETAAAAGRSLQVADSALPTLLAAGDRRAASRAWSLRAQVAWANGQVADGEAAWREAARLATAAGDEREHFHILGWEATAAVLGPTPVPQAIERCLELRQIVRTSPVADMLIVNPLASLYAMAGDFARADELLEEANETLSRLGGMDAAVSHHEALVRLIEGRPHLAEGPLREGVQRLTAMNAHDHLATTTAMLAQAVYAQGRLAEAWELCEVTQRVVAPDDTLTQVIWRGVSAKVLARKGRCGEAEVLAREAIALLSGSDLISHHGDAMVDLAEVLEACGLKEESRRARASAIALYERKGNLVAARRAAGFAEHSMSRGIDGKLRDQLHESPTLR